jgi:TonB family protein
VEVTVLRAGVADVVPGRTLDFGVGGVAAVLARELLPGEAVKVEIELPDSGDRLRTRALVRHHNKLRCGMEFVGLSSDQQAAIRKFTKKSKTPGEPRSAVVGEGKTIKDVKTTKDMKEESSRGGDGSDSNVTAATPGAEAVPAKARLRGWAFLIVSIAILVGVLWWRWERGWQDLESGLHAGETAAQPEMQVSADGMQKLAIHRVEPEYPEAARSAKVQGIVVLDVVIGREGSVLRIEPVSGPDVFLQPAADALRWWRFQPYRLDGRPITVETTVAVEFKP